MSATPYLPRVGTIPVLPALPAHLAFTQGNIFHVKPKSGLDTNSGKSTVQAFKTLAAALAAATAGQNDIVLLYAESDTAANTSDYQTATLNWNKDLVHLIGVNSGVNISPRSRIAFLSTYAVASNLFTLSANGCYLANLEFFAGVASALPTGCFSLTGERNKIENCHLAGMGNAANDIAGAYSLKLAGAENLIENCTIGVDTVTLGAAANSQILTALGATRNRMKDCRILAYTNHATNHVFLRVPASTIDRWLIFEDCQFLNPIDSGSTAMTEAAIIAAGGSPAGGVYLIGNKTGVIGATDWNSTDAGNVTAIGGTVTAATFGLGTDVTR